MIFFCWVDSASVADSNSLGASIHVTPSCSGRVNGFGPAMAFLLYHKVFAKENMKQPIDPTAVFSSTRTSDDTSNK